MGTIAIISNEHSWTYNLRKEIIEALLSQGNKVVLIVPYGDKIELLKQMGCEYYDVPMFSRRGKNPVQELRLIIEYRKLLKHIKPDVVLTYTIKPNLYGGFVCKTLHIPNIANITGLGTASEKKGFISLATKCLYKIGLSNSACVFAQNKGNEDYLLSNRIIDKDKIRLIPGSGVNLDRFTIKDYPSDDVVKYVFISRILKEKGIEQYLKAATYIKNKYPNTEFHICGFCEDEYKGRLEEKQQVGVVIYHGMIDDVPEFLGGMHCLVHPSYYLEGLSNVCLEAGASGRPVITTDHEGCRETVKDGVSGFIVPVKNSKELAKAMVTFYKLENSRKKEMGLEARKYVEENFDRSIIVKAYLEEIGKIDVKPDFGKEK